MSTIDIVKHCQEENIPRSTIYSIIKRFHNALPVEDKLRKGRPVKLTKKQQQKLKDCVKTQVGVSQRKLTAKFKVSRLCIRRNLNKMGLKYYKRRWAPKYTSKQLEEMPGKCRKLTDSEIFIIMDDENYFSFSGDNIPSNVRFWSCERQRTSSEVKFKSKRKFAPKILIW